MDNNLDNLLEDISNALVQLANLEVDANKICCLLAIVNLINDYLDN